MQRLLSYLSFTARAVIYSLALWYVIAMFPFPLLHFVYELY